MSKIVFNFVKMFSLIVILCIINPHRFMLMFVNIFAAIISWIAWRMEDFADWLSKLTKIAVKKWFVVGEPLAKKLRDIAEETDKNIKAMEKKCRPKDEEGI